MKSKFLPVYLLASALFAGLGMFSVRAQGTSAPSIDHREVEISQRIDEGVRCGRVTPRQAHRLHMREREIKRHKAFLKSDGVLTQPERRQLRNELDALHDEVEQLIRNERRMGS